jgi:hypothetical protein
MISSIFGFRCFAIGIAYPSITNLNLYQLYHVFTLHAAGRRQQAIENPLWQDHGEYARYPFQRVMHAAIEINVGKY